MKSRFSFKSIRSRMVVNSAIILATMSIAMLYTGTLSIGLARSVEVLFKNNILMQDIRLAMKNTEENLRGYLLSKSSEKLRNYIEYSTELSGLTGKLNRHVIADELALLQRTLGGVIDHYLEETEASVKAKRGRDVVGYTRAYEESERILIGARRLISQIESLFLGDSLDAFRGFNLVIPSVIYANTLLILTAFLFGFMLLFSYSGKLTSPLSRLAKAAERVGRGEYDNELPHISSEDEIGVVTRAFTAMQANVRTMFMELRSKSALEKNLLHETMRGLEMARKLKDAELLALQTQINPHFLFNTLAAGMQLSLSESAERTTDFLENLAEFMRYSLKSPSRTVRLSEEISGVERYIWLLRLRFGSRYTFLLDIEKHLSDTQVPALLLQPLVENSVTHGLKDKECGGEVAIVGHQRDGMVYLEVRDNGAGMSPDKIQSILDESSEGESIPHVHIGLHNVIRRLILATGGKGSISIWSEEGHGTIITMGLPGTGEHR